MDIKIENADRYIFRANSKINHGDGSSDWLPKPLVEVLDRAAGAAAAAAAAGAAGGAAAASSRKITSG